MAEATENRKKVPKYRAEKPWLLGASRRRRLGENGNQCCAI